jgi:hypothetical protein
VGAHEVAAVDDNWGAAGRHWWGGGCWRAGGLWWRAGWWSACVEGYRDLAHVAVT